MTPLRDSGPRQLHLDLPRETGISSYFFYTDIVSWRPRPMFTVDTCDYMSMRLREGGAGASVRDLGVLGLAMSCMGTTLPPAGGEGCARYARGWARGCGEARGEPSGEERDECWEPAGERPGEGL